MKKFFLLIYADREGRLQGENMEKIENFKILNPRLDANFKAIFTQDTDESRCALKSFLSAAIGCEVAEVMVVENAESKQYDEQRGIEYDINCEFVDGRRAQVEMQGFKRDYDYGKRAEYYASRMISSTIEIGDDWDKVPEVYQISVLNFKYDTSNDSPTHHYVMCDPKDGAKVAGRLNIIFLELAKLPEIKTAQEAKNLPTLLKWCKFLQEADNPDRQDLIDELVKNEEGIMSAEATLKGISMDSWRWFFQGKEIGRVADMVSEQKARERRDRESKALDEKLKLAQQELKEKQQEFEESKQEFEDSKKEFEETKQEFEDSKLKLEDSKKEFEESKLKFEESKKEFAQKTSLANAKNMLKDDVPPEQVAKWTSLPLEDVLELKEKLSHETVESN